MSTVLSVDNLNVAFGKRVVIDNLSFQLRSGDSLAVIGPNGSGKTVLLRALLGLVPYAGTVKWDEGVRIGYVPQKIEADRQLPLTVRDLLMAKSKFLKLRAADIDVACKEVGLNPEIFDANIGAISGGQFQKTLIALAWLGNPTVLLFDEPTASLDELGEERVYEWIHSTKMLRNLTVVLVSHDLSVVYHYADTVLCLSQNRTCIGPPREILSPQLLEELYSAPPMYYEHFHGDAKARDPSVGMTL